MFFAAKCGKREGRSEVYTNIVVISVRREYNGWVLMVLQAASGHAGQTIFDNNYEILAAVGRGRNSVVYRAKKLAGRGAGEIVALKVLLSNGKDPSQNIKRMKREALAMLACRSDSIVRLHDFVAHDDLCYISMEYCSGGDLRVFLEEHHGLINPRIAFDYIVQVLAGLEIIHGAGVLHRDLKPENILLAAEGRVKIADFGICSLPVENISLRDSDGSAGVGTFDYLAPESLEHGISDARSDVYSAGVTLFQLLTGRLPFEADSISGQIQQKMSGGIALNVPGYDSDGLRELVQRALATDPAKRFQSAREFRLALEAVRDAESRKTTIFPSFEESKISLDALPTARAARQDYQHLLAPEGTSHEPVTEEQDESSSDDSYSGEPNSAGEQNESESSLDQFFSTPTKSFDTRESLLATPAFGDFGDDSEISEEIESPIAAKRRIFTNYGGEDDNLDWGESNRRAVSRDEFAASGKFGTFPTEEADYPEVSDEGGISRLGSAEGMVRRKHMGRRVSIFLFISLTLIGAGAALFADLAFLESVTPVAKKYVDKALNKMGYDNELEILLAEKSAAKKPEVERVDIYASAKDESSSVDSEKPLGSVAEAMAARGAVIAQDPADSAEPKADLRAALPSESEESRAMLKPEDGQEQVPSEDAGVKVSPREDLEDKLEDNLEDNSVEKDLGLTAPAKGEASSVEGVLKRFYLDGTDVSMTLSTLAEGNSERVVLSLGLYGWKPLEVAVANLTVGKEIPLSGAGIKLALKVTEVIPGAASDRIPSLKGSYRDLSSGRTGTWQIGANANKAN